MRILIVEDSPTQAQRLSFHLEEAGHIVAAAASAEEALDGLSRAAFDVVVSDVVMPGLSGYDLCRDIKRRWPETPVMLLTSLSDASDIIRALEAGADNFITKPYDPPELVERIAALIQTREARRQSRAASGDGVRVVFMDREYIVTSGREQILDLLVTTVDAAVRQNHALRANEEQLREARAQLARYAESLEARLEHVLQAVPDILFSMSTDGLAMRYVSPAAGPVTGFPPEELTTHASLLLSRIVPDDLDVVRDAIAKAGCGEAATVRFRLRHKDDTIRWLDASIVPDRDGTGTIVGVDGVARDVTEARELERQLQQAQKMELVGQLAGGVAHDFNNYLCVILGWVGMLLGEGNNHAAIREPLEEIQGAGVAASGLTRQLLAFSRQQIVEPVVLSVNDVVTSADKMLRRLLGEQVEWNTRIAHDAGLVKVDRGQLEQVLLNFVVNARDAMPDGGTLTVETANVELDADYPRRAPDVTPGAYVMLAVSDTGTGMSENVQKRIFEPFFTTKTRDKGTGLGLATCHGIIKQAGGHIDVYSEHGIGTTMKVYLPRVDAVKPAVRAKAAAPEARGTESILLVEDDAAVRRVAERMLSGLGYRVQAVGDGSDALALLVASGASFDLLLTDVVLSGEFTGPALAARVRELRPDVRILFASGYTEDVTVVNGLLDEGAALVQKPFTAAALGVKVRAVLDGRPATSTVPEPA